MPQPPTSPPTFLTYTTLISNFADHVFIIFVCYKVSWLCGSIMDSRTNGHELNSGESHIIFILHNNRMSGNNIHIFYNNNNKQCQ